MSVFGIGRWALILALGLSSGSAAAANNAAKVHVVYPGQTLGKIAKRYNVSIDALCAANGITRKTPIKPKQKLIVPGAATTSKPTPAPAANQPNSKSRATAPEPEKQSQKKGSSVSPTRAVKVKVAHRSDASWKKYAKPARRPGYVVLRSTTGKWSGFAIIKGNRVSAASRRGFRKVLASWRTGESMNVDDQLIRLVTRVSDQFGGKPIRVVSGFRRKSHSRESRHKRGMAIDFSIDGVPNQVLTEYVKNFGNVGVGYYPNSTFVHLDVRARPAFWVDVSRPGQPPIYRHSGVLSPHGEEPSMTSTATPVLISDHDGAPPLPPTAAPTTVAPTTVAPTTAVSTTKAK